VHEFHFGWLLILIAFVAWELPEGETFSDIDPFEPLAVKFSRLWYSNYMNKQWQSNVRLPYLLHLVEARHPVRASHDPEYFTQVSTFDEVQRVPPFHGPSKTRKTKKMRKDEEV
jgi:UDP-galactopyranose mutase